MLESTTVPGTRTERHRRIVDVHLLLIRDDHVLMSLRQGTGYADGLWQIPSGHLEADEHTAAGAAREAAEEIGILVDPLKLELVHFLDHRAPGEQPRLGFFYQAHTWNGEPYNAEPHKCGGLAWHPLTDLPRNTVPYHAAALSHVVGTGRRHSAFGWESAPV